MDIRLRTYEGWVGSETIIMMICPYLCRYGHYLFYKLCTVLRYILLCTVYPVAAREHALQGCFRVMHPKKREPSSI